MPRHIIKTTGGASIFALEQPYYLKHSPGNPFMGSQHDGLTPGYMKGFQFKKIHWLYRYRWNSQHRGAQPFYLRNPGAKMPHWLEITSWSKFKVHCFSVEGMPHTILAAGCTALVLWNLSRYVFFHPDLTIYNVIYFSLRQYTQVLRNNDIKWLNEPVFRWIQQPPEFYAYNPVREVYSMGVMANDPYVTYIKAMGKEKELLLKPHQYGGGEGGIGKLATYILPKIESRRNEEWMDPGVIPEKSWYGGQDGKGPSRHKGLYGNWAMWKHSWDGVKHDNKDGKSSGGH